MTDQLRPPPLPPGPPTPKEPFPPAPSAQVLNQVSAIGQLVAKKLNEHNAAADARFDLFHRELALLRQGSPEGTTNDTMPSPAPVSLPKAIAGHTVNLAKWGTLAIGILGIAVQVAKVWRPSLVGPLDQALDVAKQITGAP